MPSCADAAGFGVSHAMKHFRSAPDSPRGVSADLYVHSIGVWKASPTPPTWWATSR